MFSKMTHAKKTQKIIDYNLRVEICGISVWKNLLNPGECVTPRCFLHSSEARINVQNGA